MEDNMKKILILVIAMGLAACGSNPHKVAAVKVGDEYYKPDNSAAMAIDNNTNEKIVCEKRIVTGSHRKQKTCTTVARKKEERRAAEARMDRDLTHKTRELTDQYNGGG